MGSVLLELLVMIAVACCGLLVYVGLLRSKRFHRFVGKLQPPAADIDSAISNLDAAEDDARAVTIRVDTRLQETEHSVRSLKKRIK